MHMHIRKCICKKWKCICKNGNSYAKMEMHMHIRKCICIYGNAYAYKEFDMHIKRCKYEHREVYKYKFEYNTLYRSLVFRRLYNPFSIGTGNW